MAELGLPLAAARREAEENRLRCIWQKAQRREQWVQVEGMDQGIGVELEEPALRGTEGGVHPAEHEEDLAPRHPSLADACAVNSTASSRAAAIDTARLRFRHGERKLRCPARRRPPTRATDRTTVDVGPHAATLQKAVKSRVRARGRLRLWRGPRPRQERPTAATSYSLPRGSPLLALSCKWGYRKPCPTNLASC